MNDPEEILWHYHQPSRLGNIPDSPYRGQAGGAACGDLVVVRLQVEGDRVTDGGFDAQGCGAVSAAASAALEEIVGGSVLQAALLSAQDVSGLLGGLSAGKFHAADLVADAVAQALGRAVYAQGRSPIFKNRMMVAMSGGVDSSAVAQIMRDQGYDLSAVTVELWRDPENNAESSCCSLSAVRRARMQAHRLGIPHFTLPLHDQFRSGVVQPYVHGHGEGVTLNPCVSCNGEVRIDAMMDLAERVGASGLATGHYARLVRDSEGVLVAQAADLPKDQSYMLAGVKPEILERLHLPLGERTKHQVREFADQNSLLAAKTPDSQDLCFLAGTTRVRFLEKHGGLKARPGDIVDLQGNILGQHQGAHLYTVGQRKGLGVGGGKTLYVLRIDSKNNQVVVGSREDLSQSQVHVSGVKLWRDGARVNKVKLRSKMRPLGCNLEEPMSSGKHRRAVLRLLDPAEGGVAPGQSAVLMDGDQVVGVATIRPS